VARRGAAPARRRFPRALPATASFAAPPRPPAAARLIDDFAAAELPAALAAVAAPAAPAAAAPNAKNAKLRARAQELEASLALLRKEAQEWRACRAKYIAPRDSGAAAAAADSGDEEDEELVAKYGAHAALGGVLTGRLNSVFTTVCDGSPQRRAMAVRRRHALPLRLPPQVDAVAQSLNVAGAVIDAAPAAIAAASRALHAEGFAGLLDSASAADPKGLLRRVAELGACARRAA